MGLGRETGLLRRLYLQSSFGEFFFELEIVSEIEEL